jgi:hypothetical protein
MYDPHTLVASFPNYKSKLQSFGPFIGFDIWHKDPERGGTRNRTDDSCGWFDRGPGEYADAERYVLADKETLHAIAETLERRNLMSGPYGHVYERMSAADALAVTLLVARELELRRYWNGSHGKHGACQSRWRRIVSPRRQVDGIAIDLALNPLDNLQSIDEPNRLVMLVAAALGRRFRRWWKHPRWHVHHWEVHLNIVRNAKRMFQRCAGCHKRLGFGYCPTTHGWGEGGPYFHSECAGGGAASGTLTEGGDAKQARGDSLSGPPAESGDAQP